jgi:hypothetical protein
LSTNSSPPASPVSMIEKEDEPSNNNSHISKAEISA